LYRLHQRSAAGFFDAQTKSRMQEWLLQLVNDVGLFAGVHDPVSRQMLGNIPQAFSHVGLINKALNLDRRREPERARASHDLVPQKDATAR
jgi:GH15 family glucan-1,4-alpha-glucosidase